MTIQEQMELLQEEIKDLKEQLHANYSYIGKVTVNLIAWEQELAELKALLEHEEKHVTAEMVKYRKKQIREVKKRIKACKEDLKYVPQKTLQIQQELSQKQHEYYMLEHQIKFGLIS